MNHLKLESLVEELVITALVIIGFLAVIIIFRIYTGPPQQIVCYRNNIIVDCQEVLTPWHPGYVPPVNVTALNESIAKIITEAAQ
jgi:hypothetical protein